MKLAPILVTTLLFAPLTFAGNGRDIPEEFSFSRQGSGGGGYYEYTISMEDGVLKRTVAAYSLGNRTGAKTDSAKPSGPQWSAFRRTVDSLGVWNWRKKYNEPSNTGPSSVHWKLNLKYSDRKRQSQGVSNIPKGLPELEEAFDKLFIR